MKLQVNEGGAWRDMLKNVPADRLQDVMESGAALMRSLGTDHITLRLLNRHVVYGYCEAPDYVWRLIN